jgi:hypothetical protein
MRITYTGIAGYGILFLPDILPPEVACVVALGTDQFFIASPALVWREICQPRDAGGGSLSLQPTSIPMRTYSKEKKAVFTVEEQNGTSVEQQLARVPVIAATEWEVLPQEYRRLLKAFSNSSWVKPFVEHHSLHSGTTGFRLDALRALDYKESLLRSLVAQVRARLRFDWKYGDQDFYNVLRALRPHRVTVQPVNLNMPGCSNFGTIPNGGLRGRNGLRSAWLGVAHENCHQWNTKSGRKWFKRMRSGRVYPFDTYYAFLDTLEPSSFIELDRLGTLPAPRI